MGRFIRCVLWALVLAVLIMEGDSPAVAAQMQLAQPDVAGFPRIQLYLFASGDNGLPIGGARAADFEVREGDRVVAIEDMRDASSATPIEVCLVIDRSGSMLEEAKLHSAQDAAATFLRSLRPDDRAALVSFSDRATLDRSLTRDVGGVARAVSALQPIGGTALYDALYWSVNQVALAPRAEGNVLTRPARSAARRVVLALTDGDDNRSSTTPARVIQFARANGVTIYTIGLGSDAQSPSLSHLAEATGGRYFAAPRPQALAELYALLARQLHSEYGLTYTTPNPRSDGSRREVTVTLRWAGPGLHATGWYQAPGAGSSVVTMGGPPASVTPGATLSDQPRASSTPRAHPVLWLAIAMSIGAAAAYVVWRARAHGHDKPAGAEAPAPAAESLERTLLHVNPRIDLRPLRVRPPVTEVGRAEGNDVIINSPLVSRYHARIELADGEYRLVDVGSANGTFLNGARITEARVSVGDVVRFADEEFRFAGEESA